MTCVISIVNVSNVDISHMLRYFRRFTDFIHIYTFSHYTSPLNIYILCGFFFTKCTHVVLTAFEVTIVVPLGNIHILY